jgi:phosphatidate cytidylyltransferase
LNQKENSELKTRVVTGLAGGVLLLSLMIWGGWLVMFILTTSLSLGLVYEFTQMAFKLSDRQEKMYFLLGLTWVVSCLNLFLGQSEYGLLILIFFALFIYFLITAKRYENEGQSQLLAHLKEMSFSFFGMFYLGFLPTYLRKIYEGPSGVHWALVFLFINWAGDTGAYFIGKKYGKNKLYPLISPKKSWEGAWGGLAASVMITLFYKWVFFNKLSLFGAIVIPLVVGAMAQVGDFCESFIKRAFGHKDSGAILPGHGGLLDRFDGVVFSLPIMYACIRVFA